MHIWYESTNRTTNKNFLSTQSLRLTGQLAPIWWLSDHSPISPQSTRRASCG
jgi:hypothetical protein